MLIQHRFSIVNIAMSAMYTMLTGHRAVGDIDSTSWTTRCRAGSAVYSETDIEHCGGDVDSTSVQHCRHRDVDDIDSTSILGHTVVGCSSRTLPFQPRSLGCMSLRPRRLLNRALRSAWSEKMVKI